MNNNRNLQNITEEVIELQLKSISLLKNSITEDLYESVNAIFDCKGRVVVTGVGKSALVGQKIVATFNSTGTPSIFMHATDALHGDLGMVTKEDILIIISKSGETQEIKNLLPKLQNFGNQIIALVAKADSTLGRMADRVLLTPIEREADPFDLIPTCSIVSQIVMGDILAINLLSKRGFTEEHFARFHPGGMIGKKLKMQVRELADKNTKPEVSIDADLNQVIMEISAKRMGATAVVENGQLVGIITDGDLRRMLEKGIDLSMKAGDVMSKNPKVVDADSLIINAFETMKKNKITQLLINDGGVYIGIVHLHDIIQEGF